MRRVYFFVLAGCSSTLCTGSKSCLEEGSTLLVVHKLQLHKVLHLERFRVVHDKLVVAQRRAHALDALRLACGHNHPLVLHVAVLVRARLPLAEGRVLALGQLLHVRGLVAHKLVAEGHLAQHHHARRLFRRCEAVVCRLGRHVRKVHTLAEHVARRRRLRRRNAQPLRQDAAPVGKTRAVPQKMRLIQPVRGLVLLELRDFVGPGHLPQGTELELVHVVGRGVRVLQVRVDHREPLVLGVDGHHLATQRGEVAVDGVKAHRRAVLLQHARHNLHVHQVLHGVVLLVQLLERVQQGTALHVDVGVRHNRVEAVRHALQLRRDAPALCLFLLLRLLRVELLVRSRVQDVLHGVVAAGLLDVLLDLRQHGHACLQRRARQLPERHLLCVDLQLLQQHLHLLHVEDELNELARLLVQLAGVARHVRRRRQRVGHVACRTVAVVDVHHLVEARLLLEVSAQVRVPRVAGLVLKHLRKLARGSRQKGKRRRRRAADGGADAAPLPEQHPRLVLRVVRLEQLHDVVRVLPLLQVYEVQRDGVDLLRAGLRHVHVVRVILLRVRLDGDSALLLHDTLAALQLGRPPRGLQILLGCLLLVPL
eukprot:Rhum_TRINITY_DN4296_c0_g1::Rhum_TRINITY_DN4296_c0_g1_i1::g.13755::m.13755